MPGTSKKGFLALMLTHDANALARLLASVC